MSVAEASPAVGLRTPAVFDGAHRYRRLAWIAGALTLAAAGIASALAYWEWIQLGVVMLPGDLDPYIRLVRVRELLAGVGWFDGTIPGSHMGAAEYLAWSRPFDLLIVGLDWPLRLIVSEPTALLLAGSLVSPLLLAACVPWLVNVSRTLGFGIFGSTCVLLAFVCHPLILPDFRFGRGDHHSLLMLSLVTFTACFLRALQKQDARRMAWTGVVGGVGIWIHPEFTLFLGLAAVYPALQWCREEPGAARNLALLAAGACGAIALGLVSEAEVKQLFAVEHDRVSVVHLTLFAVVLAGSTLLWKIDPYLRSSGIRVLFVGLLGAGSLAALEWLYPGFHLGPARAMDPRLHSIWFERLVQSQPLLRTDDPEGHRYAWITGLLFAYGVLHLGTLRASVGESQRRLIDCLLLSIVGCFVMALAFRRAASPMAFFCVLPLGYLGDSWIDRHADVARPANRIERIRRAISVQGFVFCCAMAPHLVLAASDVVTYDGSSGSEEGSGPASVACRQELQRWIQEGRIEELSGLNRAIVITRPSDAPALLYWTRHRVVAWNHHRSTEGLMLLDRFFATENEIELRDVVRRTEAELVLYCPTNRSGSALLGSASPHPLPSWLQALTGDRDQAPVLLRVSGNR